jgi:hypothetical protein
MKVWKRLLWRLFVDADTYNIGTEIARREINVNLFNKIYCSIYLLTINFALLYTIMFTPQSFKIDVDLFTRSRQKAIRTSLPIKSPSGVSQTATWRI